MAHMEKTAVGKQTGGFMQTRKKTRPYRVNTLVNKKDERKPSDLIEDKGEEGEARNDPEHKFNAQLAGLASPEFSKEGGAQETSTEGSHSFDLLDDIPITRASSNRGQQYKSVQEMLEKEGARQFAPGIPAQRKIETIPRVKTDAPNQEWDVVASLHPARVRGDHVDLRLVDPKGRAHSWALPKELPDPGRSTYAIQQPTHTGRYALRKQPFTIPEGYGATRPGAQVRPLWIDKAEVVEAGPSKVRFLRHHGQRTDEYVLRRIGPDDQRPVWALNNATKTRQTAEGKRIPDSKPKMREIAPGQIDFEDSSQAMLAKIDGAHSVVQLLGPDHPVRVYSYRRAQRPTGLIDHTYKFPRYQQHRSPRSLKGTVLRAEVWASDRKGRSVPPSQIGSVLNASVPKARRTLQDRGHDLRLTATDVIKFEGKDYSNRPFSDRLEAMRQITKQMRGVIEMPPVAVTPQEKSKLIKKIQAGRLRETKEGVVLQDLEKAAPGIKVKFKPSHDVYVRDIFTKPASKARGHAGGFEYSWEPDSEIVGRVGTGFDHRTLRQMLREPEAFVGRVAKVESQDIFENRTDPSQLGAMRAPSFIEWHIDKTPPELMKEAAKQWLYHGSPEKLTELRDPGKGRGVFLTTKPGYAAPFVIKREQVLGKSKAPLRVGQAAWEGEGSLRKRVLVRHGDRSLSDVVGSSKGYLYRVDPDKIQGKLVQSPDEPREFVLHGSAPVESSKPINVRWRAAYAEIKKRRGTKRKTAAQKISLPKKPKLRGAREQRLRAYLEDVGIW